MNSLVTIFLLSAIVGSTIAINNPEATRFDFAASINCPIAKTWCVQLEYWERDTLAANDKIGSTIMHCSPFSKQVLITSGVQDGDEIFNNQYELFVTVKHNCRLDGRFVQFDHDLGTVPIYTELARIPYSLSL